MTERNSCRLRWNSSDGGTSRGTGERPFDGSSSSCFSTITPSDGSAAMWYARSPAVFDFACGRQSILSAGTRSSTRAVTGASRSSSSAIVLVMGIVTLLGNRIFAAHYTSAITVETDYRRWATLLREIAEKKFSVPQEDAEALVNEDRLGAKLTVPLALSHLRERCRRVLRLYYLDGYSIAELGEHLKTTPGYAAQVLHECRRRLRQIYRRLARERKR